MRRTGPGGRPVSHVWRSAVELARRLNRAWNIFVIIKVALFK